MVGIVFEGESGSELPVFYNIVVEDIVFIRDAWVFNKGIPKNSTGKLQTVLSVLL